MCSVSYLCRFLPYCLQLVSYPYFITDCLSSVSLSFFLVFFCIQLNLISLYCWDFFQKLFASNSVYCLTLIHINTHYTIQYIYTHTHTQRHVRTPLFCFILYFFILYYISISLILTLVTRIMKILWNERSQQKKKKKKKLYRDIYCYRDIELVIS